MVHSLDGKKGTMGLVKSGRRVCLWPVTITASAGGVSSSSITVPHWLACVGIVWGLPQAHSYGLVTRLRSHMTHNLSRRVSGAQYKREDLITTYYLHLARAARPGK